MNGRTLLLGICCLAGACAGPVRTRYGGMPTSPVAAPSISALSLAAPAPDRATGDAIAQALNASGISVDAQSPYELHIGLSARPAAVGAYDAAGHAIAAPRKTRLLQSCANSNYRLVLTVSDRRDGAVVARGWAEESHCAASLADTVPVLARHSVAMLLRPMADGSTLRWTKD